ncbi:MAG: MFS transporter [Robiginitomaculum sp.]|nr:MFS transporter [Robiginitomaculum sp.]
MSAKHAVTLLTSRRFLPLFLAQLAGAFNDQFLKLALIALVTWGGFKVFGMEPQVIAPIAGAIFTGFFLIFSAMAGQVADKFDKALVLLRVKQAEIFIMLLAAVGFFIQSPILLLITVALMGAQSAFFSPTRNAVLPQWLTDKELISGNALISGFVSVAILLGQALGLFLVVRAGGLQTVAIILVVLAVLGWLAIRQAPPAPAADPDIKIDWLIIPQIIKTFWFAWKRPNVFKPMLGTAWYYWLSAAVLILMPAFIKVVLHYDQSLMIVVMVIFTLGALAGAMSCMVFSKPGKEAITLSAIGALGVAAFTFDLFLQGQNVAPIVFESYVPASESTKAVLGTAKDFFERPGANRFMGSLIGAAFSSALFVVPLNTMAQSRAEPLHRARLLAAGALLLNLSTTLSQLMIAAMGWLSIPMHFAYAQIAFVSLLIAAYGFHRAKVLRKMKD